MYFMTGFVVLCTYKIDYGSIKKKHVLKIVFENIIVHIFCKYCMERSISYLKFN